jgi:hypothetical protein
MVTHEVWLEGAAAPVTFELENDELFQLFKRWIEKDSTLTASGWVGTAADKKWIINFNKVAGITTSANNERRTMGFAR